MQGNKGRGLLSFTWKNSCVWRWIRTRQISRTQRLYIRIIEVWKYYGHRFNFGMNVNDVNKCTLGYRVLIELGFNCFILPPFLISELQSWIQIKNAPRYPFLIWYGAYWYVCANPAAKINHRSCQETWKTQVFISQIGEKGVTESNVTHWTVTLSQQKISRPKENHKSMYGMKSYPITSRNLGAQRVLVWQSIL